MKKMLNCIKCLLCLTLLISCQKKNEDSSEILAQARLYMTQGHGVEQNFPLAAELLTKSANMGNSDAMWELGCLYEYGRVFEKDFKKAFELYKASADKENAIGYYQVGHMYQHGFGVPEDPDLSWKNYKKSYDMLKELESSGDVYILNFIGSAHFWGDGTALNKAEGFRYYMMAAEKGYPECQWKVATSFESGIGVEKDLDKAIEWYTKAANQGYPEAIEALSKINNN